MNRPSNDNKQLGHVNKFMVANGLSEFKENVSDLSPYSGFEGELDSDFDGDEFSEAGGRRAKRTTRRTVSPRRTSNPKLKRAGTVTKKAFGYTPLGAGINLGKKIMSPEAVARRQKNKEMRFKSKEHEKAFQQKIIDKGGDTDILLNQLAQPTLPTPIKTPMKTSTKIIIGVSVVAVLGTVAFVLYKKFKK